MRAEGLEPPHLAAPAPKAGVSTNSTTPAGARSWYASRLRPHVLVEQRDAVAVRDRDVAAVRLRPADADLVAGGAEQPADVRETGSRRSSAVYAYSATRPLGSFVLKRVGRPAAVRVDEAAEERPGMRRDDRELPELEDDRTLVLRAPPVLRERLGQRAQPDSIRTQLWTLCGRTCACRPGTAASSARQHSSMIAGYALSQVMTSWYAAGRTGSRRRGTTRGGTRRRVVGRLP